MNPSTFSINSLSEEDTSYLENVMIDLRSYINNLHTCTHKKDVKCPDVVPERKTPVAKKVTPVPIYRPPPLRSNETESSCSRKERKTRKPDMQIYVPRGRRLFTPGGGENQSQDDENSITPTNSNQKNSNADVVHTPKKQKMVSASSNPEKSKNIECISLLSPPCPVTAVPVNKLKDDLEPVDNPKLEDEKIEVVEILSDHEQSKVMEDLCLNTSMKKRNESIELCNSIESIDEIVSPHPCNLSPGKENLPASSAKSAAPATKFEEIDLVGTPSEKNCDIGVTCSDGESHEKKKVEEITMDISSSESTPSDKSEIKEVTSREKSPSNKPASTSISAKENSSLNVNECEWDELFDDEGEYVDKSLINELMTAIGKVSVQQAAQDYKPFQTVEERTSDGGCVIEVYGFPSEFKTEDLLAIFATYRSDPNFQIIWVDDTHALAVFTSPSSADKALNTVYPFIKTRPIKNAIPKSRTKAQNFILPPVSRPKTCVSLARRLVSGHLGMKINVTDQQRAAEKKILSDAREKRRLIAKQRQDAWEGPS